jgi:hypothetical protein
MHGLYFNWELFFSFAGFAAISASSSVCKLLEVDAWRNYVLIDCQKYFFVFLGPTSSNRKSFLSQMPF